MKGLIDIEVAKNELEEAKKTGSMDEVFGKYCNKRPQAKECVLSFIDSIKPCLEETEKQALNVTLGVVKQLSEFVCFRDGDRIASKHCFMRYFVRQSLQFCATGIV